MPDYNAGRAHGEIIITADTSGVEKAKAEMASAAAEAEVLDKSMGKVNKTFDDNRRSSILTAEQLVYQRGKLEELRVTHERYSQQYEAAAKKKEEIQRKAQEAARKETTSLEELRRLDREFERAKADEHRTLERMNTAYERYQNRLSLVRYEVEKFNRAHLEATTGLRNLNVEIEHSVRALAQLDEKLSSVTRALMTVAKFGLLGGGAGASLGLLGGAGIQGVTTGLGAVVEIVKDFAGAMLLVPGVVNGAVLSLGTLKVAFHGVFEELGNLEDPAAFAKGLRELAPAAQQVMLTIQQFTYAFRGARLQVQESLFEPIIADIQPLIQTWLPQLMNAGKQIANEFGQAFHQVFQFFQDPAVVKGFQTFVGNLITGFQAARQAIQPFLAAWNTLATVGSGVFERIGKAIATVATEFNNWVQNAASSGKLLEIMNSALDAFTQLGHIVRDLGIGIINVFNIAEQQGGNFIQIIANLAAEFRAWTESVQGKQALTEFFQLVHQAAQAAMPIIKDFGRGIMIIIDTLLQLGVAAAPGITSFFDSLVQSLQVLGPALVQSAPAISEFFKAFGQVILQIVQGLGPQLPNIMKSLSGALIDLLKVLPPVANAFAKLMEHVTPKEVETFLSLVIAIKGLMLAGDLADAFTKLANPMTWVIVGIGLMVAGIVLLVQNWPAVEKAVGSVTDKFGGLSGILDSVKNAWNHFLDAVKNLPGMIGQALQPLDDLAGKVGDWGEHVIHSFADGIRRGVHWVHEAVDDVLGWIDRQIHGKSPPPEGPLSRDGGAVNWGAKLTSDYASGIASGTGDVSSAASSVAGSAAEPLRGGGSGLGPGGFTTAGQAGVSGKGLVGGSGFEQWIDFITKDMSAWSQIGQQALTVFKDITDTVTKSLTVVADLWNGGRNPLTQAGGIFGPPALPNQQPIPGANYEPIYGPPPDSWANNLPGVTPGQRGQLPAGDVPLVPPGQNLPAGPVVGNDGKTYYPDNFNGPIPQGAERGAPPAAPPPGAYQPGGPGGARAPGAPPPAGPPPAPQQPAPTPPAAPPPAGPAAPPPPAAAQPGQHATIPDNPTPDQVKAAIVQEGRNRGISDDEIAGILGVAQVESNFGPEGFMGFSKKLIDSGSTAGAQWANDYNKALQKFYDNYQAGGYGSQGATLQQARDALKQGNTGPLLDFLQNRVQGAEPRNGYNQNYQRDLANAFGTYRGNLPGGPAPATPTPAPAAGPGGGLGPAKLPAGTTLATGGPGTYSPEWLQQHGVPPVYTWPAGQGGGDVNNLAPQWLTDMIHTLGGPDLVASTSARTTGGLHGQAGGPGYAFDVHGNQEQVDKLTEAISRNPDLASRFLMLIRTEASGEEVGIFGGKVVRNPRGTGEIFGESGEGYPGHGGPLDPYGQGGHVHIGLSGAPPEQIPSIPGPAVPQNAPATSTGGPSTAGNAPEQPSGGGPTLGGAAIGAGLLVGGAAITYGGYRAARPFVRGPFRAIRGIARKIQDRSVSNEEIRAIEAAMDGGLTEDEAINEVLGIEPEGGAKPTGVPRGKPRAPAPAPTPAPEPEPPRPTGVPRGKPRSVEAAEAAKAARAGGQDVDDVLRGMVQRSLITPEEAATVNPDLLLNAYHATSPEAAEGILKEGFKQAAGRNAFFATDPRTALTNLKFYGQGEETGRIVGARLPASAWSGPGVPLERLKGTPFQVLSKEQVQRTIESEGKFGPYNIPPQEAAQRAGLSPEIQARFAPGGIQGGPAAAPAAAAVPAENADISARMAAIEARGTDQYGRPLALQGETISRAQLRQLAINELTDEGVFRPGEAPEAPRAPVAEPAPAARPTPAARPAPAARPTPAAPRPQTNLPGGRVPAGPAEAPTGPIRAPTPAPAVAAAGAPEEEAAARLAAAGGGGAEAMGMAGRLFTALGIVGDVAGVALLIYDEKRKTDIVSSLVQKGANPDAARRLVEGMPAKGSGDELARIFETPSAIPDETIRDQFKGMSRADVNTIMGRVPPLLDSVMKGQPGWPGGKPQAPNPEAKPLVGQPLYEPGTEFLRQPPQQLVPIPTPKTVQTPENLGQLLGAEPSPEGPVAPPPPGAKQAPFQAPATGTHPETRTRQITRDKPGAGQIPPGGKSQYYWWYGNSAEAQAWRAQNEETTTETYTVNVPNAPLAPKKPGEPGFIGPVPVKVTNTGEMPGGPNGPGGPPAPPSRQPGPGQPANPPTQTQGDVAHQGTGAQPGPAPAATDPNWMGSGGIGPHSTDSPMTQFATAASGIATLIGDAFKIFDDVIKNIQATADIAKTAAIGLHNTEDIVRVIQDIQTYITTAADIAKTVSDVTNTVNSFIPSGGDPFSSGAKSVLAAIGAIAGIVQSALEATNAAITLGIEIYHEVGKYAGYLFGAVLGGALGTLGGNVRMILNTRTGEIMAYSEDNPLNKNVIKTPFTAAYKQPPAIQNQNNQMNIYTGPGQSPMQMMQNTMWMVSTGAPQVASVAAGSD